MCELHHKTDKTRQNIIICDNCHIIRVNIDNAKIRIKTRLKTNKTKEYKIVKMSIKSGGSMDRTNRSR